MRYIFSGYFTDIFLYLCLIRCETSYLSISAYAISSNSTEEIKNIFSLFDKKDPVLKGEPETGNFAEGGPIFENITWSSIKTPIENSIKSSDSLNNISASSNPINRRNISSFYTNLMLTKLTESESNLFLGMSEVIHSNGTSSIKPRKGAPYNKIVPRKGVYNENEVDIYSITTTQNIYNNDLNYSTLPSAEKKQHNSLISQILGTVSKKDFLKEIVAEDKNLLNISEKNPKLKPSITKVPYDVEVVTEILSKDRQKVFVPIVVSLFLLPLIGILIFFLWRRIKDYWDKRYYKRTDFLIDGMYND